MNPFILHPNGILIFIAGWNSKKPEPFHSCSWSRHSSMIKLVDYILVYFQICIAEAPYFYQPLLVFWETDNACMETLWIKAVKRGMLKILLPSSPSTLEKSNSGTEAVVSPSESLNAAKEWQDASNLVQISVGHDTHSNITVSQPLLMSWTNVLFKHRTFKFFLLHSSPLFVSISLEEYLMRASFSTPTEANVWDFFCSGS